MDNKVKTGAMSIIPNIGNTPVTDHITEYFADKEQNKQIQISKEIFNAKEDIDVRTQLGYRELVLVNAMQFNDLVLKEAGLNPVYSMFLIPYMRLKLSLDRQSRIEFVTMNKGEDKTGDMLDVMSKVNNITGVKK